MKIARLENIDWELVVVLGAASLALIIFVGFIWGSIMGIYADAQCAKYGFPGSSVSLSGIVCKNLDIAVFLKDLVG